MKLKPKFDYSMFACSVGFIGIITLILIMLITNGLNY